MKLLHTLAMLMSAAFISGASAQQCDEVVIRSPSPFMGNDGEVVKLSDGSYWEVSGSYEYMYAYFPRAVICSSAGQLIVRDRPIRVNRIAQKDNAKKTPSSVIESTITSEFGGLNRGNVYRLANGQLWEQIDNWIWIWIWVNPSVTIYQGQTGYMMKVENIEHAVAVRQIR